MTDDRVWLCALDLDRWEDVAALLHPAGYPSPRLPEDARIASAATDALVRVAVHEIAGPDIDASALLNPEPLRLQERALPFDQVTYSISHAPHALAVAVSLSTIGIDIEPVEDAVDWKSLGHGVVEHAHLSPDLRSMSARDAHQVARTRAATKASGEAMPMNQADSPVQGPGWAHLGGSTVWVSDVNWRRDHAVAVAAYTDRVPVVLQTTASQVLERWREISMPAASQRSNEGRRGGQGSGIARLA